MTKQRRRPQRAMIEIHGMNNGPDVRAILKDKSLPKDLKKVALKALVTNVQTAITSCSFMGGGPSHESYERVSVWTRMRDSVRRFFARS